MTPRLARTLGVSFGLPIRILSLAVVVVLARVLLVVSFAAFFSEQSLGEELRQGILVGRLVGPAAWGITLAVAALIVLIVHTARLFQGRPTLPTLRRIAPVVALLILSPWVGEYLLGNISARELVALPFLVPLYGCGALLVREIARRTGRGWPAIFLLAAAYGIIEAGLVDQSLFNPNFEGWDFQTITPIPALGLSAYHAFAFIIGHAIWSVSIPIAIVEMLTPPWRRIPWLSGTGLAMAGVFYLLGCIFIFQDIRATEQFMASPAQMIGAGVAAVLCIVLALARRDRSSARPGGRAPKPWLLGTGTFIALSAFVARPEDWLFGVWVSILLLAAVAAKLASWSKSESWTIRHEFALVAGALPVYAWLGFVLTFLTAPADPVAWGGNVIFAIAAIGLLVAIGKTIAQDGRIRPEGTAAQ